MSKATTNGVAAPSERSYFEQQREVLVRDIGSSMEQVLQNINKLNRSLEGIVAVGGEFSSVEALWSHFEGVMGKTPESQSGQQETEMEGEDETVVGSKDRS